MIDNCLGCRLLFSCLQRSLQLPAFQRFASGPDAAQLHQLAPQEGMLMVSVTFLVI